MKQPKKGDRVRVVVKNATLKNMNGDVIVKASGEEIGKLQNIRHVDRKSLQNCYELNYGVSPLRAVIRDLIYLDLLEKANAQIFMDRNYQYMTETERSNFMEKYGVQIDPKKVDEQKKDGEKTAGADDPKVNVPKHPDKGTEPFEKREED